ncbi:hypothetical protein ES754_08015 [Psychrobacter frigidicola]|uniref:Uncharacterized protein n=1 Tax=Psychrobacter frigidicola TaxID=45611 RepID=A0A5C7A149_9GAMM|nr:hypothetical protein [Psychrobacter frigidicola]TXD96956.1 hypothetical protein ES754_08015 [Psychrobacter frigidicola]
MKKTTLTLIMGASLLFATSACQPPADMPKTPDTKSTSKETVKEPSTQPLIEAKTPRALTNALVALSEEQLTNKLVCTKLSDTMKNIDNKSKIEDIHAIQRQLNACLPMTDNLEILQWLKEYQALYGRFLGSNSYMDDENFYDVVNTIQQGQKLSVKQLKALSPRRRYLIELVASKADVSVLYIGEGIFIFHHDLKAMADLFIPYLPADQAKFIQRMAQDNQDIFWNDAAVAVSFNEVIARAKFWESYIQRYPTSYFSQDAKNLFNMYRYVLFYGSDNTRWTDDAIHEFLDPKYTQAMAQLTTRSNSTLAQDAQIFLNFMTLSDRERKKKYPVPSKDNNGNKIENWAIPRYQLTEILPILSPWEEGNNRDCLSSIICVDYNVE